MRIVALSVVFSSGLLFGCGGGDDGASPDGGSGTDGSVSSRRDAGATRGVDGGLAVRGVDSGTTTTPTGPTPSPDGTLCDDSCTYANDDECDDGGPDSDTTACAFGSDCGDCGTRDPSICTCGAAECGKDNCGNDCGTCEGETACDEIEQMCVVPDGTCNNTCQFADDGDCDDGGEGADYSLCPLGSDCVDCGAR